MKKHHSPSTAPAPRQTTYDRLLAKAHVEGITILASEQDAKGRTLCADVSSSHGDGSYRVTVGKFTTTCNCLAGDYCKHRALLRERLLEESAFNFHIDQQFDSMLVTVASPAPVAPKLAPRTVEDEDRSAWLPSRPTDSRAPFLYR